MSDIEYTIGTVDLDKVARVYENIYGTFTWGCGYDPKSIHYWSTVTTRLAAIYVGHGGDLDTIQLMDRIYHCSAVDAANDLRLAFNWDEFADGNEYWSQVYTNLLIVHRRQHQANP